MIKVNHFHSLLSALELNDDRPLLIGIDGRPCSGKSKLADMLINELSAEGIFLDDFFIPREDWPSFIKPAFPFPYFRYREFLQGVKELFEGKIFEYSPYDWATNKLGEIRRIDPKNIIIIEGVSVLCKELLPCFYKKILVMSNKCNELEAIQQREKNLKIWKALYLPSVDIYWQTNPEERADVLFAGRGIAHI